MAFQLSAQAITAQTALTRMSVRRCSTLPRQRGSTTAPKCPTSRSMAMLRSPVLGREDHPWLGNSPASGMSCVAPGALCDVAARHGGATFVPENRSGPSGILGAQALLTERPDGTALSQMPVSVFRYPV